MPEIEHFRGKDLLGSEVLSQVATNLIVRYSSAPTRGNVRLRITPRIVRHYLNEDLLGEPTGQMGAATIFNYGNLLRLLAVKKLLVENWSILKIRELIRELDITALENFIRGDRAHTSRSQKSADPAPRIDRELKPGRDTHEQRRERAVSLFSPKPTVVPNVALPPRAAESDWVELAPGLELRVRRGFRHPPTNSGRQRIQARFNAVVFGADAGEVEDWLDRGADDETPS
jgi:hypothetical protein